MTRSQFRPVRPQTWRSEPLVAWVGGNAPAAKSVFVGRSSRTIAKIVRFAGVGVASSILYAIAVFSATSGLHIHPDLSAVAGYAVTIPFNFCAHRWFTFGSTRRVGGDAMRYLTTQAVAILLSSAAMAMCVDVFRLPYVFGIAAVIGLVPIASYMLLDRWAFGSKQVSPR